eukprot:TRINITY_DN23962_c0_g1_i1.p1 TRINITY_DN23962_c0_g1~~TRINITY_DN23962_c0_g1_i1.p1  ORF type:complete len:423 (+),score=36.06 TRINITY_DN23962_c0_g1_i1:59-1327(+)
MATPCSKRPRVADQVVASRGDLSIARHERGCPVEAEVGSDVSPSADTEAAEVLSAVRAALSSLDVPQGLGKAWRFISHRCASARASVVAGMLERAAKLHQQAALVYLLLPDTCENEEDDDTDQPQTEETCETFPTEQLPGIPLCVYRSQDSQWIEFDSLPGVSAHELAEVALGLRVGTPITAGYASSSEWPHVDLLESAVRRRLASADWCCYTCLAVEPPGDRAPSRKSATEASPPRQPGEAPSSPRAHERVVLFPRCGHPLHNICLSNQAVSGRGFSAGRCGLCRAPFAWSSAASRCGVHAFSRCIVEQFLNAQNHDPRGDRESDDDACRIVRRHVVGKSMERLGTNLARRILAFARGFRPAGPEADDAENAGLILDGVYTQLEVMQLLRPEQVEAWGSLLERSVGAALMVSNKSSKACVT